MSNRYFLAGARGGQGTTTMATILAVLSAAHQPTALVSEQVDDVCALTGTPRPRPSSTTPICPNLLLNSATRTPGDLGLRGSGLVGAGGTGRTAVGTNGHDGSKRGYGDQEVQVVDLGRLGHAVEPVPPDGEPGVVRWLVVRGPCYLSLRAAVGHSWQPDGVILLAEPGRSLSSADVADVLGAPVVAQVPVEPVAARVIDAGLLLGRLHRLSAFRSLAQLLRASACNETPSTTRTAS